MYCQLSVNACLFIKGLVFTLQTFEIRVKQRQFLARNISRFDNESVTSSHRVTAEYACCWADEDDVCFLEREFFATLAGV